MKERIYIPFNIHTEYAAGWISHMLIVTLLLCIKTSIKLLKLLKRCAMSNYKFLFFLSAFLECNFKFKRY